MLVSLQKYFGEDLPLLSSQCTDSGSGSALDSLHVELKKLDICSENYVIGAYTLHCLQITLKNSIMEVLGEDGATNIGGFRHKSTDQNTSFNRNAMQLLCGVHDIQNHIEYFELKKT